MRDSLYSIAEIIPVTVHQRTIINNQCNIHGEVDGKSDLRLKLVIDDGTGSISCFLNKELVAGSRDRIFITLK